MQNTIMGKRKSRINILLGFLAFAMLLLLFSIFHTIISDRRIPSHNKTIYNRALRGAIISKDNYKLSYSEKNYKAVIRGASIRPEKKNLFIKLFSIYSGISEKELQKKFIDSHGKQRQSNIILSSTLHTNTAMRLKSLAVKLRRLGVFRSIKLHSGINVLYGLDIIEIGEYRKFPLKDVLSPVLGYVGKIDNNKYIRPKGMKGLEANYNKHIAAKRDGFFKGKRDVLGIVIHDKNSIKTERVDGLNLHLNISLNVQRRVEYILSKMKNDIDAEQIIAGVMESDTGNVLALASTERYDPAHIQQKDIPNLNPKFSEYPYEAGSVIKPLTLAIALNHKKVTPNTWFNTFNGKMKIGKRRTISDDEKFEGLTATDIIVHSSNVGISQISWKLSGQEFRDGLIDFGISRQSGIDLSRDLAGKLKPLHLLNNKMHRANSSYGYGMLVTFTQLFKAYSAFNNDGIAVTPRIVSYLGSKEGKHYILHPRVGNLQAVSKKSAQQIHKILVEVVKRGTGVKAQYPGLEIGGKTGTAHIAKHGHYVREFHSSFYGFANDKKGHKYTIGVLVIKAKKPYKYFASASAVPTFKHIVDILVDQKYLDVDPSAIPKKDIDNLSIDSILKLKKPIHKKKKIKTHPIKKKINKQYKKVLPAKPKVKKSKPATKKSANELFEDLF